MRILVIGNSKSAEILTNFLSENKDLLVFTTKEGTEIGRASCRERV